MYLVEVPGGCVCRSLLGSTWFVGLALVVFVCVRFYWSGVTWSSTCVDAPRA